MELIVKPTKEVLEEYINSHIKNFLLPLKDYSVEYLNYYDLGQIRTIRKNYPNIHLFISINKNILNKDLETLKKILLELDRLDIKGIFYYDLAILQLKKELNLKTDLVWNQTHMVTNYKTCNYYYDRGVKYALLSKEITKTEILDILRNTKITPIVELISYPVVATSKRKLVTHYYQDIKKEQENSISLIESKTKQEYLALEDQNGVSFVLKRLMNGSKILRELLEHDLKYILLKEDFMNHDVFMSCLLQIEDYIKNYQEMSIKKDQEWQKRQNELLGRNTNFFYRRTIYKVK